MIWFCCFCKKKKKLFLAWPMGTPFLHRLDWKMVTFTGFSKIYSELLDSN